MFDYSQILWNHIIMTRPNEDLVIILGQDEALKTTLLMFDGP